jgi:RHS repeat-associated protein
MGRIWQLPITGPSGAAAGIAVTNATYEPFGPLYTLSFGNGVSEARRFDLDYRITALAAAGFSALEGLSYAYDAVDNVLSIADAVTPGNSQNFGYDSLNRLTSATGAYGAFGWTYDKVGNRLKQNFGTATTTYGYTAGTNRLASITAAGSTTPVSFTAAGNISSTPPAAGNPTATLRYNAANRLSSVTGVPLAISSMIYDAFGQRYSKANPGSIPTLFTYGQEGALLEESQNNAATDYIYLNGRPVANIAAGTGQIYYLHTDRLGTPQLATDSNQNVAWSANYQPFGDTGSSVFGAITQNLRFSGHYFDGETGWNHNGFRDYAPSTGRYAESDLIGLNGGLNSYAYANGNPPRFSDPSGLCPTSNPIMNYPIVIPSIANILFGTSGGTVLFMDDNHSYPVIMNTPNCYGSVFSGRNDVGISGPEADIFNSEYSFVRAGTPLQVGDVYGFTYVADDGSLHLTHISVITSLPQGETITDPTDPRICVHTIDGPNGPPYDGPPFGDPMSTKNPIIKRPIAN